MSSPLLQPLHDLAAAWRRATSASRRRAAGAVVSLVWLSAALVARHGTASARAAAAAVMVASAIAAVAWQLVERRRLRQPSRIVHRLVLAWDRERGERALRALSLVAPDGQVQPVGTSPDLARLHVARAIAQIPSERILEGAARTAARVGLAALAVAVCSLLIVVTRGWSVFEGANVLLARHGQAPVSMRWLDEIEIVVRPPDYLHEGERRGSAMMTSALPYGTQVTVRGIPTHPGRKLLLGASKRGDESANSGEVPEVAFVDDGAGAVVARWTVTQSVSLRVVARFGDVSIAGSEALAIESIPDARPTVRLTGAPRQIQLLEQGDDDIPVQYKATDDHGLREVHLVLRSGTREERRVLARLDGLTTSDEGGRVLRPRDPFLKKSHAPVQVTVEAKDNDPLTGPKWGASEAIVIVPPAVGEPEARRLEALRTFRDALVDLLAWQLSNDPPAGAPERSAFVAEESKRTVEVERLLARTLDGVYGGLRVPTRIRAALSAPERRTRRAVDAETKSPSSATHGETVKATERYVLVTDAIVRGLGLKDARGSARQLADVADDLALGASQARDAAGADAHGAEVRMDAATQVLAAGGGFMKGLGTLGQDLGEIVDADLLRVKRARQAPDMPHAEWAARDLASRLHEPDPSFGARGGAMGRALGESGGAQGTPGDEGPPSEEVDRAFQEAAGEVEQLAQDHAGVLDKVDRSLAEATGDEELDQLREEGKRHAEAVRQAARSLPNVGNGSDSWTSKGAAARELAERMAGSLEQAQPRDALQSGRSAVSALDEARKMLERGGWFDDPGGEGQRRVDAARRVLDAETKWAEKELEQLRKRASDRARKQLEQSGDEENKLAERARDVAERARERGSLPQPAVDSLDDAERAARRATEALRQGEGEQALERQREAQRALEAANDQIRGGDDDSAGTSRGNDDADGRPGASKGSVPSADAHKGPEEFRRRVVRGLGQPSGGALRDAVRRYAEGLLR